MSNTLKKQGVLSLIVLFLVWLPIEVFAHGVDESTRAFLQQNTGTQIIPFLYIGAKHMVTGYDHLLFLVGVMFFLYKSRDILLYVSMFTLGHSLTLLVGVLSDIQVNAYLIDAIIGLSVVYKAFDNLGGFTQFFGKSPNAKVAVLIFGLFHGFGLATKLQEFQLPDDGLIENLIAFNIGVEVGQFTALAFILLMINCWRTHRSFTYFAKYINCLLMSAGLMLVGFQLTGFFIS
jgi:hypothetical protein